MPQQQPLPPWSWAWPALSRLMLQWPYPVPLPVFRQQPTPGLTPRGNTATHFDQRRGQRSGGCWNRQPDRDTYNGAQQMTGVTKGSNTYTYTYAGASQNEILSQTTPEGTYKLTYGRTDAQGLPIIEQLRKDNLTAYVEHDPVTGEPLMLRTSSGMQSLYVYDGTGNPAALITSASYVGFAYAYDPYGKPTLTEDSGGLGVSQTPYTFKVGLQDRATGWVKYGQRWYNPGIGRWTQMDTLDAPLDPANAHRYAYAANDPINNSDPLGLVSEDERNELIADGICLAGSVFLGAFSGPVGIAVSVACFGLGALDTLNDDS